MKKLLAAGAVAATLLAAPGLVMAQVGGNLAATPSEPIELNLSGGRPPPSGS